MPQHGVHAITVPGAVDGWHALAEKLGEELGEDLAGNPDSGGGISGSRVDVCVLGRGAGFIASRTCSAICRNDAAKSALRTLSPTRGARSFGK